MSNETQAGVQADYYTILGVPRDATIAEIRTAYRLLSQNGQPESGDAGEIEKAYEALSDPDRRLIYNQLTGRTHRVIYCPFCSDYDPDAWIQSVTGNYCLYLEGQHATVFRYERGWRTGLWGFGTSNGGWWKGEPFPTEAAARAAAKRTLARSLYHCCD